MKAQEIKFKNLNKNYSILIGNNILKILPNKIKSLCPQTKKIALIFDKGIPGKYKKSISKKKTQLLEDFLELGEKCNIKIIHDKGDFNGDNCLLFSNDTIVINKHKPLEQRLYVLAKCFSQINLDNVYIKPMLRDLINQAKTDNT